MRPAIDSPRLSARARDVLADSGTDLLLSAASASELAVKTARGHLTLPVDTVTFLRTRMTSLQVRELPVTIEDAARAADLPAIHSDPWDRILVAQARREGIPILTADRVIGRYDVETLW